MSVKDMLKRNVPAYVKDTPEWSVFLKWISQKNIKTSAQLKSVLKAEIAECNSLMKKSMSSMRNGTNTRITRRCAKQLDFLKLCRDKICKYL